MATGTVKFFNGQKGFGFIAQDGGGPDVFVHVSAVERAGMRGLAEGQKLTFDIEADRTESNNLAEKHPEIVKELSADYDRWAERCGVVPWSEIEPHRPAPATQPARRPRG